jgi:endoglucanase
LALGGCSVFFPDTPKSGAPSSGPFIAHLIHLNTVGFVPSAEKVATVEAPGGDTVEVHDATSGAMVWSVPLTTMTNDELTQAPLWIADFTAFTDPGQYYLEVPGGVGKSATFKIAADVYNDVLMRSMIGMYGQRCGTAVSFKLDGNDYSHAACHKKDGSLKYLTGVDTLKVSTGGWHDAGDYGKYITNGAFALGMLLAAWEQFQPVLSNLTFLPASVHNAALPDFLAESKWELDWLLTTPSPDGSGGVPHKLTALNFESFIMPEIDASARYFTGVGTSATADFVAVMAAAGRLYTPYDATFAQTCLTAAQTSYAFLQANPARIFPDDSAFATGGYDDNSDLDERAWAAAELWDTTGDAAVLTDLETRLGTMSVAANFDWQNVDNLAIFRYLLSTKPGRNPDLVAKLQGQVIATANSLSSIARSNSYGRAISYWWGAGGAVARTAMNLATANALSPDPKYTDTILIELDHLLGRNHYDRSLVTMVGYHPPLHPHHRPSAADNVQDPWPGLLVGGQDTAQTYDWVDDQNQANLNEIAINWTGAMVYATAAVAH